MPYYADRVKETTTVTGTSSVVPTGAVTGFQSFTTAFTPIGFPCTVPYCIDNGAEWEVGIGTLSSGGFVISRDTIVDSSNAGSIVSFSAGTKTVFCTMPSINIDNSGIGVQMLVARGMALP